MKALFVCNQNQNRSKTAEEVFRGIFETKSAGLYGGNLLNEKTMAWADTIFVMDEQQISEIAKRFPKQYLQKKIVSLEIPDMYTYGQPELIEQLKIKLHETISQTA